jgi:hypothetical protein
MTSDPVDLRRFPRVHVKEGFFIRFQIGARRFFGLPITTLGGGGCCIRVSTELLGDIRPGAAITGVYIENPGIPQRPQRACVSWVQDAPHAHEEPFVLVGIEYLEPDLDFIQAVDHCIAALVKK